MTPFRQLHPAAEGLSLSPLIAPELATDWVRDAHARGESFGQVHAQGVWRAHDARITGYGHVWLDGDRFAPPGLVPAYIERRIAAGEINPAQGLALPERVIDEPVVAFMGYGQRIWGHALIEMAPKIRLAAESLCVSPADLAFIIPSDVPVWFRELVRHAGARRFVEYDPGKEHLRCPVANVVTLPLNLALHPSARSAFTSLCGDIRPFAGPPLFITRRDAATLCDRPMLNAADVEAVARGRGFRVIRPETLSLPDQIRLFASAPVVAGAYGSGLHNAVFCRPGTVIGSIGCLDRLQSAISALMGLRQSYLETEGDPFGGYSVDLSALSDWLMSLLDASDAGEKVAAL